MRYHHVIRTAAGAAATTAAAVALGLAGLPGAAAADPGQLNLVDLSIQQGSGSSAADGGALTFSIHNAGPDDAAGPVEVDVVLVRTMAATQGLPDGCATLGGSADQGAPMVRCVLADAVPANGAADVSIPLATPGASATDQNGLAVVHVSPAPGSSDVDTNPLNNDAMLQS